MAVVIIFCLMFLFLPLAKQSVTQHALASVLDSLEMLVEFYQSDYRNLNVDGLFGLRVLEGHLDGILQKHVTGTLNHLPAGVISRVKSMKEKATRVCKTATEHVQNDDLQYFNLMKYVVGSPWNVFDNMRRQVDIRYPWDLHIYKYAKKHVKVDEQVSDECMSQLIGTHKDDGKPCDIDKKCAEIMTAPGLVGYGITHQILWTMLAEKAGCRSVLDAKLGEIQRGSLAALRLEMCSNNYAQLVQILGKLKNMVILPYLQDLFLEELFICPSLGYYQFLSLDFLPQILSWQLEPGCFGKMARPSPADLASVEPDGLWDPADYVNNDADDAKHVSTLNSKNLLPAAKRVVNNTNKVSNNSKPGGQPPGFRSVLLKGKLDTPSNQGRKLLVEKAMSGDCLAHKTAVASGALIIYLRFLIEPDANVIFNKTLSGKHPRDVDFNHIVRSNQGNNGVLKFDKSKPYKIPSDQSNLLTNESSQLGKKIMQNKQLDKDDAKFNNKSDNILSNKQRRDTAKLGQDNHQLKAPDFQGNQIVAYDNNELAVNNNNLLAADDDLAANKPNANKGGHKENYEDGDGDNDDEDDDDYDYVKRDDKGTLKDDDYYDHGNIDGQKADRQRANAGIGHLIHDNDEDNDEDYNNADDGYDDKDDDYADENNDGDNDENMIGQPHINARNIGKGNQEYDNAGYNEQDKSLNHVRDYKYDDGEEDDYQYDDNNEEVEKKREVEVKKEDKLVTSASNVDRLSALQQSSHISSDKLPSSSALFLFAICMVFVLLLLYRFIRKRRIRIRFNPKHFHV